MAAMTRRIRNLVQILLFAGLLFLLLFLADSRFRVLPDALHSRLPLLHHAGTVITDITLQKCSTTNPLSKCQLDPQVWHRVEKDLYLGKGWVQSAWLHVQRKLEQDLTEADKVVIGVRVQKLDPGLEDGNADWEKRPGGIWVLRSSKRHESDSHRAITAIDVLFGTDAVDPRPNWNLGKNPLDIDADPCARLTIRHEQAKTSAETKQPRVRKNGRFKILQVSDAHMSTGVGKCRDAVGDGSRGCEADPRTLEFLERILEDEKPDLVILSGDQVEGPAAPDTQSAIFKLVQPLVERGIPYAAIFGNHDDEGARSLSRAGQMSILQSLPYSLSLPGPDHIDGVGNYYLEILAPSPSEHSALTIYLLDSHGLTPDEKNFPGYDWLKQSQIEWFRATAAGLKKAKAHTKFTHIHLDMAFIHIPLPEFADPANVIKGGEWKEDVSAPKFNSGFFSALAEEGVLTLGVGHDHVNDYCALPSSPTPDSDTHHGVASHKGPWMCYAGGSGFGGYGRASWGYQRRVRLWEVDTGAGKITTWKRVECCGDAVGRKVGDLVVVDGGRVVGG